MSTNDNLTRKGIFIATGYLCAGVVVAIFASLSLWATFFDREYTIASIVVSATFIAGIIAGMLILRPLIPRVGVKAVFEQDVLIMMIGLLFMSLAMNQAMLIVGLLITGVGMSWYFTANFNIQVKAASKGGSSAMSLAAWAVGPVVSVAVLNIFDQYGLLTLRLVYAHFIVIAFWVWVQRLGLHIDYSDAPKFVLRIQKDGVDYSHHHSKPKSRPSPDADINLDALKSMGGYIHSDSTEIKDGDAAPPAPKQNDNKRI